MLKSLAATPVIASSMTGVAGVMPASAGLVVPAHDAAALARAIERCISNPHVIPDMSASAREFAETFSTDKFVEELTVFLHRMI